MIDDRLDVLQAQAYFKNALTEAGATFGDDTWADWYASGCGIAEHDSFSIEFSPPLRPELKFRLRLIFPWGPDDVENNSGFEPPEDLPEVYMYAGSDRSYQLMWCVFQMKDGRPEPNGEEKTAWPALFSNLFTEGVELIDYDLHLMRIAEQNELERRRRLADLLKKRDAQNNNGDNL